MKKVILGLLLILSLASTGNTVFVSGGGTTGGGGTSGEVEVTNQATLQRLVPQTLLNAVSAIGNSVAVDVTNFNKVKFTVVKTGTATVDIQESSDNSVWVDSVTNVDDIQSIGGESFKYVRANVSAHSSGTVTVVVFAGN